MVFGQEDEELYSGYDDSSNASNSVFRAVGAEAGPPGTSMGEPGASMRNIPTTAMMRGSTAMPDSSMARPMTSNRGAGFSSIPNKKFDPMNRSLGSTLGTQPAMLVKKGEISPEEQAKDLEKRVHELLEESAILAAKRDVSEALDKAIEAKRRERALTKFRDANNLGDQQNVELTYAIDFNLAHMYHLNKNYQDALNQYTVIVRNKNLQMTGRLRVNMGNIYFEQKKFATAIKMYRMALDQIPATAKEIRFKIMRNIGLAFVRMGQYQDALQAFSTVMENVPDHQTGHNLVVCAYALGDREGMKRAFQKLIEVSLPGQDGDDEEDEDDTPGNEDDEMNRVVADDGLKEEIRRRRNYITRVIVQSAQLISEKIDRQGGFEAGYAWCIEQLRTAGYVKLANEVELAKASKYMGVKEFDKANSIFKEFEKKEPRTKARAATNLSFLYFLEAEVDQAEKYSEMALKADRYNARAYVNKGNVLMERGNIDGARTLYNEAAGIDPYCVEAIFNLGLASIRLQELPYALAAFKKLHNMLPDNVEVIHQIANIYDMMGDFNAAVRWLEHLSSLVPNDPGVLAKLGAIHQRFDEEAKALHYYQESHRVFPVNMDVISWLGAHHVKNELYEKAMPYFDLASKIQPQEVKWSLMVASCYRRIGNYPQALLKYKQIHTSHPDNVECLRYLVHLATELGRRAEAQEYVNKLKKAEKNQGVVDAQQTVQQAAQQAAQRREQLAMTSPGEGIPSSMGMGMGGGAGRVSQPGPSGMGDDEDVVGGISLGPQRGKKVLAKEQMGTDDWGNEQLGDDLLPM